MTTPPSTPLSGNRPAYMDSLFGHASSKTHSLRSASSSISHTSTSSTDRFGVPPQARPSNARSLSPAFEQEDTDDKPSIRSLKLPFVSPRRSFRNLLNRRTYPQVKEMVDLNIPPKSPRWNGPTTWDGRPSPRKMSPSSLRRPSLPRLEADLPPNAHMYTSKPLPATPFTPLARVDELRCQPCYYFAARHCNSYVLGGSHGDACENCLAAGFFGAS